MSCAVPVRAVARSCARKAATTPATAKAAARSAVQLPKRSLRGSAGRARATVHTARGNANSSPRARFLLSWSALATLGASSVGGICSSMRTVGTSFASTAAFALLVPLVMPQGTGALCVAGQESEDKDKDEDSFRTMLRIARDVLLGEEEKGGKGGKKEGGTSADKDEDSVNKLAGDLADAVKGFGGDVARAVDGAVQRKNSNGDHKGIVSDFRSKANEVMDSQVPAQMSFGFIMGVCCGFAAKKTAKVALVGVGLAFGSLQVLSYMGYVQLDYTKIEGEVMGVFDLDKNGKVDGDDIKELFNRTMKVAAYNLPTGSGFAAGALVGARMG